MPDHQVFYRLPEAELGRADALFKIKKDNKTIGTLHISYGASGYKPSGWAKKNMIKLTWQKFDKLMRENKK